MTQRSVEDKPDSGRIKPPPRNGKGNGQKPAPKTVKKITATYLHNAGLYYLQRFAASTGQFRRIMQRKIDKSCHAHPEQNAEECERLLDTLIETFQRSGLLNDNIYATGAIRSLRQRGLSARIIMAKMATKGISAALVQKTLNEIDGEHEGDAHLLAALKQARRRRIGPFLPPDKPLQEGARDKHLAAMARAGFDFETARRALSMDKEEAEDFIRSSGR
jgi:regulatory protein